MSFIRRIFAILRRPKARYGEDVLFAGWVDIPALAGVADPQALSPPQAFGVGSALQTWSRPAFLAR